MPTIAEAYERLATIPLLQLSRNEPLLRHTRFGLGGPAAIFADTDDERAFVSAGAFLFSSGLPWAVLGCGSNVVAADAGFRGVVLRYLGARITRDGPRVDVQAGALLQDLVDFTIGAGLRGIETMTGIPGNTGAAIYGNAGAYGASISDVVERVRYFDGASIREADRDACEFRYRTSIFKRRRLLILSATLRFAEGDAAEMRRGADEILVLRNRKFPPEMQCAGSIFKNLVLDELTDESRRSVPESIVKGGKAPAAWFLEQVGAKGLANGGIRVKDDHANTLYNAGGGTAAELREIIWNLKDRVKGRFGLTLDEEVQYMGFDTRLPGVDQLATTPQVIQGLLAGLEPRELHWRPGGDRWSIAQVLAHLADAERKCFQPRARAMAAGDNPVIEPYEPETITPELGLAALEEFLLERKASIEHLDTLTPAALPRTGHHKQLGLITLEELLCEWAFHDLGHVRQIAELVRASKYYPHMGPFAPLYEVNP